MATYEHKRTGRRMTVSGADAEASYNANPMWRRVADPKPLTPKEQAQADAAALGLSADGKVDEIKARVEAKVAELRELAVLLGIDADSMSVVELAADIAVHPARPLSDDELLAATEAKLLENVDSQHDPAEVRAKLAELAELAK